MSVGMSGFDESELALITASLRHVLDTQTPAEVPGALLAAGWNDLVDADPAAAITALSELAGRARSAAPVLDLAILRGAGIEADATTAVLIDNVALAGTERARRYVRLSERGVTAVDVADVQLSPATGFDPALGLSHATFVRTEHALLGGPPSVAAAIAMGRRALASQMVGAVDQMLVDTLAYVTERHQYGRAIGSFQTVKHRLAEVKVASAAAQATVRTAWEHADTPEGEILAIAAKALAGRAQQLASTHCFQVHGGIAFTVEHGFHQWVRRGLLLDHLLGDHRQLTKQLGARLIAAGATPRVPELA